jgi:predicted nuclease of predicted toxin-antitoxin system
MFVIRGGSREASLPSRCMKLLIDQNLSRRLTVDLQANFPGTSHVWRLGLAESPDEVVWEYAAEKGYAIVSKDTDFINLALLNGHPPSAVRVFE